MSCILIQLRQFAKCLIHVTLRRLPVVLKWLTTSYENLITYLGTTLTGNVTDYINTRIQAARRAYYGLQSSGVTLYKVGIQPILTYGCSAVNIDHNSAGLSKITGTHLS